MSRVPDLLGAADLRGRDVPLDGEAGAVDLLERVERGLGGGGRELAPYLVAIAGDRPGDAPLFVSEASRRSSAGRRWSRHMAYNHVRRICAAAKVPTLPPQALRRTQSTLATEAGVTALAVAQHLGHATSAAPAVTHWSYVERDAAREAAIKRGLRVLQGGRRRPVPDLGSVETTVETDPKPRGGGDG